MRTVDNQAIEVSDTLRYELTTNESNTLALKESQFFGVLSMQSVSLKIKFKNETENVINIYPGQTTIAGKEGNRNVAFDAVQDTTVIAPGSSSMIVLNFIPIHSRFLFQYTNLRGDLDNSYAITFFGTTAEGQNFQERISAKADVSVYEASMKKFAAQNQVVPYQLAGTLKKDHQEYLKNAAISIETETETKLADNEILRGGFWMKLMSYHRSDTLHCRVRFVNQSGKAIEVKGTDLILLSGTSKIQPIVRSNGALILQNGDRGEIDLKYSVKSADEFVLNLDGVRATNAKESYFTDLFSLTKLQVPK
jgi:hypothetical protein